MQMSPVRPSYSSRGGYLCDCASDGVKGNAVDDCLYVRQFTRAFVSRSHRCSIAATMISRMLLNMCKTMTVNDMDSLGSGEDDKQYVTQDTCPCFTTRLGLPPTDASMMSSGDEVRVDWVDLFTRKKHIADIVTAIWPGKQIRRVGHGTTQLVRCHSFRNFASTSRAATHIRKGRLHPVY